MREKTARVPVTPELLRDLRAFRDGLNAADYDEAINFMLQVLSAGYSSNSKPLDPYNLGKELLAKSETAKVR